MGGWQAGATMREKGAGGIDEEVEIAVSALVA
jgi:hypothetical protein